MMSVRDRHTNSWRPFRSVTGRLLTLFFLCLCAAHPAVAGRAPDDAEKVPLVRTLEERPDFAAAFESRGVTGTVVFFDAKRLRWYVHDAARAEVRFPPASSYKVFNALVILEEKAVRDEHEVIEWDGVERGWDKWDRDHSIATAIKYSALWVYQACVERIGLERVSRQVNAMGYGNRKTDDDVTTFWIDGTLLISAVEQVDMLRRLRSGVLPFSKETMATVCEIMVLERTDSTILRGKTGWARRDGPGLGWFIGWREQGDEVVFFALNLDIEERSDAKAREAIVHELIDRLDRPPKPSPEP